MAFMVPVMKKDYDIYSKSPPKNKPIVRVDSKGSNNSSSQKLMGQRQQSNSITIGLIQQQKQQRQRNPQRIHSKSCNETQISRNERNERSRQRSTSNSSSNSSESFELIRKMMHFISFESNSKNNTNSEEQSNNKNNQKTHWTAKIFRKRKNSLNNHKLS